MKISEIMNEAKIVSETPLPDDWDSEVFKPDVSFAKRLKYAVDRAKKIGTGSSRVAFEVEYQGRPTVLKVAKNVKGLAQNEEEVRFSGDYVIEDWIIPMIDYDEKHDKPLWVHVEKAEKARAADFRKFFDGLNPNGLIDFCKWFKGDTNFDERTLEKFQQIVDKEGNASDFASVITGYDIPMYDLTRLANWGKYNGKMYIIDIGLSHDVYKTYY